MGVATLSLRPRHSLITMTRDGELYMARTLNVGLDAFREPYQQEAAFKQITSEILRSLDYYESHSRQSPIRQLALLPVPSEAKGFVEYLRQFLGIEVNAVDLNELVANGIQLPKDLQAKISLAFGAALREQAAA